MPIRNHDPPWQTSDPPSLFCADLITIHTDQHREQTLLILGDEHLEQDEEHRNPGTKHFLSSGWDSYQQMGRAGPKLLGGSLPSEGSQAPARTWESVATSWAATTASLSFCRLRGRWALEIREPGGAES